MKYTFPEIDIYSLYCRTNENNINIYLRDVKDVFSFQSYKVTPIRYSINHNMMKMTYDKLEYYD